MSSVWIVSDCMIAESEWFVNKIMIAVTQDIWYNRMEVMTVKIVLTDAQTVVDELVTAKEKEIMTV